MNLSKLWIILREQAGGDGAASGGTGGDGAGGDGSGAGGEPSNLFDAAAQVDAGRADGGAGGDGGQGGGDGGTGGEWFLAEGIKGEGEPPEYYKADKYKSLADQAKAYAELEKKLGGFTGAPEGDYEISVPDDYQGPELTADDPLVEAIAPVAKELGMSQEGFTKLIHAYLRASENLAAVNTQKELEALGRDAATRITNLKDWAQANLSEEQFNVLGQLATTADNIQLFEQMMALSKENRQPGRDTSRPAGISKAELEQLQMATDANGNRRMSTDPEYAKMVRQKMKEYYGDQPYQEIVR